MGLAEPSLLEWTGLGEMRLVVPHAFEMVGDGVAASVGPAVTFILSVALFVLAFQLFDRVFAGLEVEKVRGRIATVLQSRWASFGVGLLVTAFTTSIAISLGAIVPLYTKGYVRRDELLPYILGANIGTMSDTLLVAFFLEPTRGIDMILVYLLLTTAVTLAVLVFYEPFERGIDAVQDWILAERSHLAAVVVLLVAVPALLVATSVVGG